MLFMFRPTYSLFMFLYYYHLMYFTIYSFCISFCHKICFVFQLCHFKWGIVIILEVVSLFPRFPKFKVVTYRLEFGKHLLRKALASHLLKIIFNVSFAVRSRFTCLWKALQIVHPYQQLKRKYVWKSTDNSLYKRD